MGGSLAGDRFQPSLSSTLSIARYFRELLRFRDADGIASVLAGGIRGEKVTEGGCLRDVVALTHVSRS